jgi:oligopeptide/dipeptide ABC transporter ATP-binding protein
VGDELSLLNVDGISVQYIQRRRAAPFVAVNDVSFDVKKGETVALVGESGSGKTTIGNAILGLSPVSQGSIRFDEQLIVGTQGANRDKISKSIQVIFQDPFGSLNPRRTIGQILVEPLMVHRKQLRSKMWSEVERMLVRVGLPRDAASRYPRHFSGGQRQRIAIARAMIIEPRLVVCDEPVSSLDLSVQAQILNLLGDLQVNEGLSYLFISHDIAVVRHLAHRVVVLYKGRVVESGTVDQVCGNPRHPYTRALFLAAPIADPVIQRARNTARRELSVLEKAEGDGCPYYSRCAFGVSKCAQERPELRPTPSGSLSACHRDAELPGLDVDSLWPRTELKVSEHLASPRRESQSRSTTLDAAANESSPPAQVTPSACAGGSQSVDDET